MAFSKSEYQYQLKKDLVKIARFWCLCKSYNKVNYDVENFRKYQNILNDILHRLIRKKVTGNKKELT